MINSFFELADPDTADKDPGLWLDFFDEDMLYLEYGNRLGLDLAWAASLDTNGRFVLSLISLNKGKQDKASWDRPLAEFVSRSKAEVLAKIEEWTLTCR